MRNNKNIPQSKPESRITKALKQYARVHIGEKTNNIYSIPLPQTPKISENKKKFNPKIYAQKLIISFVIKIFLTYYADNII